MDDIYERNLKNKKYKPEHLFGSIKRPRLHKFYIIDNTYLLTNTEESRSNVD